MQTTYTKDGFLFFKEDKGPDSILGDRLVINPNDINISIDYINLNGIKSITINPAFFKVPNLDFLKQIPHIEGLYILQEGLDTFAINFLSELKVLRLDKISSKLDFSNLKDLEVLSYTYNKTSQNINSCTNLFWLWVDGYKKEDLSDFSELHKLKYLNLYGSSIINLEGIAEMNQLLNIRLDTMKNLESLKGLNTSLDKVEVLDIYNAKKLTDYKNISELKSLKQLELRKTGESESIDFLNGLSSLNKVTIGFKVLNGNMDNLKGIQKVGFIDYPHYNHRMKDFNN